MTTSDIRRLILCGAISSILTLPAGAALEGYWAFQEVDEFNLTPNAVEDGIGAFLSATGTSLVFDAERGSTVIEFDGVDGHADAGSIPEMTIDSDFTWSFWSLNLEPTPVPPAAASSSIIVGNRYNFSGTDSSPREFIKFTNAQVEFHRDGGGEDINYADMPSDQWVYTTMVKEGDRLLAYRNGVVIGFRTITDTPMNSQPFYFGGQGAEENWKGRLDDVAIWSNALPASSVRAIARGLSPADAPLVAPVVNYTTVFSDDFSAGVQGKWDVTNRGLEKTIEANYAAPSTAGGVLSLGGTTDQEYWAGRSIESKDSFSSSLQTLVSVDRISLSGGGLTPEQGGTPDAGRYRSSLWILGDDGHYFHLAQTVGEGGWSWNANDVGGTGTQLEIGAGNNMPGLDSLDASFGYHKLQLELIPTGVPGAVSISAWVDGMLVATHDFSAFPENFKVVLTGQGRKIGDYVDARFDNVLVQQVPEPSTALLLLGGALTACARRRRRVG